MSKLSKNFSRSEFACKCGCGFDDVDPNLILALQKLRDWWRLPVTINSGCRCHAHNEAVQKQADPDYVANSSKSQHLRGTAADIVVAGISPPEISRHLDITYPDNYGIGAYNTFTHFDVRRTKGRW